VCSIIFLWSDRIIGGSSSDQIIEGSSSDRIIGGSAVPLHSIPFLVTIVCENPTLVCGGSLISPNYVLTHAFCTLGNGPESLKVIVGDGNSLITGDGEQSFNVKAVINYPSYFVDRPYAQAFSLLQLNTSVVIPSPTAGLLCLPSDLSQSFEGETLKLSGWGRTSVGGQLSNVLKAATGIGKPIYKFWN
jgi:hypothetical protein